METQSKSRVLKWSVIIGIVIVLNLFFNYALSVVYHSPQYTDFCKDQQVNDAYSTQSECLAVGGQWTATPATEKTTSPKLPEMTGSCDPFYTCQNNYTAASNAYDRNVFVTLVVLGVLSIGVSLFLGNVAVSQGLSLGGVLSFLVASTRYWGSANDLVKLIILAAALAALIYLAYKKFGAVQ